MDLLISPENLVYQEVCGSEGGHILCLSSVARLTIHLFSFPHLRVTSRHFLEH